MEFVAAKVAAWTLMREQNSKEKEEKLLRGLL